MMKAKKGNRVVRIPDEKIEEYKKLGYTITDMDGNMVYEHVDPAQKLKAAEEKAADLEKENRDLTDKLAGAAEYAEKADRKIDALKKENAELRAEVERLKGTDSQGVEDKPAADAEPAAEKTGKGKAAKSGK